MKSCIIMQGSLYTHLFENIKNIFTNNTNCIISTWSDESETQINELKNIDKDRIVISKKPAYNGIQNVNYANKSIIAGIHKAQKLEYTHCLRFRTDWEFSNFQFAIQIFEKLGATNKIVALTWFYANHTPGYLLDHVMYGPLHLIQIYRSPIQLKNDRRFTELFLQETYFNKINIQYNDIKNDIVIAIKPLLDAGIKLINYKEPNSSDKLYDYASTTKCILD